MTACMCVAGRGGGGRTVFGWKEWRNAVCCADVLARSSGEAFSILNINDSLPSNPSSSSASQSLGPSTASLCGNGAHTMQLTHRSSSSVTIGSTSGGNSRSLTASKFL